MSQNQAALATGAVNISQFELINMVYKSKLFNKIELKPTAKLVLYALIHHYNPANEDMFPSQKFIAQNLGISEKSVERAVKELAANRLIMYVTRNVNRYKFTSFFFDSVNLSDVNRQNVSNKVRQIVGQTYKHEQKNENKFYKFSSYSGNSTTGATMRQHSTIEETKKLLENIEKTREDNFAPKDFSKDDAIKWLNNLPPELHGGILAQEVYKKHKIEMSEKVREILISRGKLPKN